MGRLADFGRPGLRRIRPLNPTNGPLGQLGWRRAGQKRRRVRAPFGTRTRRKIARQIGGIQANRQNPTLTPAKAPKSRTRCSPKRASSPRVPVTDSASLTDAPAEALIQVRSLFATGME